jgi:hypothetical protein
MPGYIAHKFTHRPLKALARQGLWVPASGTINLFKTLQQVQKISKIKGLGKR